MTDVAMPAEAPVPTPAPETPRKRAVAFGRTTGGIADLPGHFDVGLRRRDVARWVIMHHDDRRCPQF